MSRGQNSLLGRGALIAGVVATFGGCASTKATAPPAPAAFTGAPAEAAPAPAPFGWVETLPSSDLAATVRLALADSPDLAAAEARAAAASARARSVAGRFLPQIDLDLSGDRTGTPTPGQGGRIETESVASRITARWEADVWGRVLDRSRAALADGRAARQDLAAAQLSVAGQAGRAWVALVEARQLETLAREDLAIRARALEITDRRYARGIATSLALRTARAQTASARAALASAEDQAAQAARRLEAILGRYPDAQTSTPADLPPLAVLAAPSAPADLLARRPDVGAAEARVAAAGLRVSEARKALLPRFTLSASGLGDGDGLADVTDVDALVTRLVAGLTAPLFEGGALRAEARAAEADRTAAAAAYVAAALGAWREVEDALSADRSLALRETELAAAADESREAQTLAEREYERGVATIFELIDAYTRRIDAERGLITTRAQRVSNRIAYHIAVADPAFAPSSEQAG